MAYTTIDDPSAYFHTQLYTGNNSTTQTITNNANAGDFQADWLWIKNRDDVEQHHLMDSNRGANKFLHSNASDDEREGSYNGGHNDINAFGSNGFTITSNGSGDELNFGTRTYVAWQWKANGGTTSTNTSGTSNSTVQANTTAGFSIVTRVGTGSAGATYGHGLGKKPDVIINKEYDATNDWYSYWKVMGDGTHWILLDATGAKVDDANMWNDTAPTSTVFSVGNSGGSNGSNRNYLAYCFTAIQGYSKFGEYTGNGNANGPFVYLGFKPAFVIIKATSRTGEWVMLTGKIATGTNSNPLTDAIYGHTNAAETGVFTLDFLSNGFKIKHTSNATNGSDETYIYMAFAEHPFVSSEGVPVTAR
jgi:hypothetical protein